jgi:hypothetical protein
VRGKRQRLAASGTLNFTPEKVQDRLFQSYDFFDPEDLLQVKYEMLRRVERDGTSVSQAAHDFGFSRRTASRASCRTNVAPRARINSPMTWSTSSPRRVKRTSPVTRLHSADGSTITSGSRYILGAWRGPWRAKKKQGHREHNNRQPQCKMGAGGRL